MFAIDGIVIKNPDGFRKNRYKISNLERLTNGDMVGDQIARKREFTFTYNDITSNDLDTILEALWEPDGMFHTLTYTENNEVKTCTVYPGAIPAELHRGSTFIWIWKNVSFSLIER